MMPSLCYCFYLLSAAYIQKALGYVLLVESLIDLLVDLPGDRNRVALASLVTISMTTT